MPDPFCTLPTPLPLMIFEAIEDLSTLQYLLEASPSAAITFEQHYCGITEAVLGFLTPELQRLLRTLVAIESNRSAIADRLISFADQSQYKISSIVEDTDGSLPLTKLTSSYAAVRGLISSADQVQRFSQYCLDTFLARADTIRPYRIADGYIRRKRAGEQLSNCHQYQPLPCGPASWIEEQRVIRASWRLKLYFCVVGIAAEGEAANGQAANALRIGGPLGIWNGEAAWQLDELDCVSEFVMEKRNSATPLSEPRSPASQAVAVPQRPPEPTDTNFQWEQAPQFLDMRARSARLFIFLPRWHDTPLHRASSKPFMRFGIGIWDRKKMVRLGLDDVPPALRPECDDNISMGSAGTSILMNGSWKVISRHDLLCRYDSIESQTEKHWLGED